MKQDQVHSYCSDCDDCKQEVEDSEASDCSGSDSSRREDSCYDLITEERDDTAEVEDHECCSVRHVARNNDVTREGSTE